MPLPKAPSKPATILDPASRNTAAVPVRRALPERAPVAPIPIKAAEVLADSRLTLVETHPPSDRDRRKKARAVHARRRLFVLDTNVLMHDPTSLFRFEEHDLFLPMMTLEELDGHKKGMSEVARNARQASRSLDSLVATCKTPIEDGIALSSLGNADATGRLFLQTQAIGAALPASLPVGKADNQILSVVRALKDIHPDRDVVLVSKDINMRVKARALDLAAEDYFNDKVLEDTDILYTGVHALPANFWDRHGKGMESWQQAGVTYYRINGPVVADLIVNQFVYLEEGAPFYAQVREIRGRTAVLRVLRDYLHSQERGVGSHGAQSRTKFCTQSAMRPRVRLRLPDRPSRDRQDAAGPGCGPCTDIRSQTLFGNHLYPRYGARWRGHRLFAGDRRGKNGSLDGRPGRQPRGAQSQ